MKALPSLFVGLATLLAGCSSWNNRPASGLAGPPSFLSEDPETSATSRSPGTDTASPLSGTIEITEGTPDIAREEIDHSQPSPAIQDERHARTVTGQTTEPDFWIAEYESQQRRPIQVVRVGQGERRTLISGSLHGDEPGSAWLLDRLSERLRDERAQLDSRFLLVRTPNPDGLEAAQQWNANGVDLNQNFPPLRSIPPGSDRAGRFPASEPETRVMLRLLSDFQPDCVIQVRTAAVTEMQVFVNAAGESVLGDALDELELKRDRFNGAAVNGSLEAFVAHRMQAEMVTVVVPESAVRRKPTVDVLLTLCNGGHVESGMEQRPSTDSQGPLAAAGPRSDSGIHGPATLTGILESVEQDGAHGFVEFLPPPPEKGSSIRRPGYYELPPPP